MTLLDTIVPAYTHCNPLSFENWHKVQMNKPVYNTDIEVNE